jgi:hypothetical protein
MRTFIRSTGGETLISVIMGTIILAFAIATIAALLTGNAEMESGYEKNNAVFLLQNNATTVIRKLDTSSVQEGEVFYLFKDTGAAVFKLFTGATNEGYRYVNIAGEMVNTGATSDAAYARTFLMEKKDPLSTSSNQVVKVTIRELIRK